MVLRAYFPPATSNEYVPICSSGYQIKTMRSPLDWNSKNEKAVCSFNVFLGCLCSVPDVGLSELTQQPISFAFLQTPRDAQVPVLLPAHWKIHMVYCASSDLF